MTQAQHTPGPWYVSSWPEPRVYGGSPNGIDPLIAAPTGGANHTLAEAKANARLIAAAPDLLAELVEQHSYWRSEMSAMNDLAHGYSHDPERAKEYAARGVHAKIKAEKLAALIAKARGEA